VEEIIVATPLKNSSVTQRYGFQNSISIRRNHGVYYYSDLMMESALFILCKSLRKIFAEGLVDEVKDEGKWKQRLKGDARLARGAPRG